MTFPIAIQRGEDVYLIDEDGRRYLSFAESINILGYGNSRIVNAIKRHTERLIHYTNELSVAKECVKLGRYYLEKAGLSGGFLYTSSGSEANEYALLEEGVRKKRPIVGIRGAYHGQLYLTGAITRGLGDGSVYLVDPNQEGLSKIEELQKKYGEPLVLILEPIMVHAGIVFHPREFLESVKRYASRGSALIIADEVYLSPGKTGYFYSHQAMGLKPNVITLGKSIGGGLPLGMILYDGLHNIKSPLGLTTTSQGGNRTACEAGLALLGELNGKEIIENVRKNGDIVGRRLREEFFNVRGVVETRGMGYIHGVQLDIRLLRLRRRREIVKSCISNGLLVSLMGKRDDVIRLAPPLTATLSDWEKAISTVKEAIRRALS